MVELSKFPEKHKLVDDTVLASWGIQFVIVKIIYFFTLSQKRRKQYMLSDFFIKKVIGWQYYDSYL